MLLFLRQIVDLAKVFFENLNKTIINDVDKTTKLLIFGCFEPKCRLSVEMLTISTFNNYYTI